MRAATIFKPACSNLEVICPMAFFATASGLTMDKVRSTAMQDLRLDSGSDARNSPNVLFYQAFAGASRPAWVWVWRFVRRYQKALKGRGKQVSHVSVLYV